jgi:signal transduction histidine kinase
VKRRIIIGLACFTLIFFLGGIYIINAIQKTTSTLNDLIKLHQVEILREQLLSDAKLTLSDFAFQNTRYASKSDTVVANVVHMAGVAKRCSTCHHSAETTGKIAELRTRIQSYEEALSRVLTVRASPSRLIYEEDGAFRAGRELINQLDSMTLLTRSRLEKKTASSLKRIGEMKSLLFILIAAGPVFAVGLAVIFIQGFTKPLNEILRATRKVKNGDLEFRIQGLRDEFGEVAASFNEMAKSLNEHMQNLQRAEQMKVVGEIAAGLVHEIKNPLTGIKASMQVLLEQESCEEEDRVVLSKVLDAVMGIEGLMKSLLNFAKPPKPRLVPVDMNMVLESTVAFSLPYASVGPNGPRDVIVVKDFDPHLPSTLADPGQMQQVFLNLFMNALEAMPGGGTLTVRTSAEPGGGLRIEIRDTGKGIDRNAREKLFVPFFTTKHKGTGLGLAVTKRFVEAHGGTISADENPAGGTIFRILLPPAGPR